MKKKFFKQWTSIEFRPVVFLALITTIPLVLNILYIVREYRTHCVFWSARLDQHIKFKAQKMCEKKKWNFFSSVMYRQVPREGRKISGDGTVCRHLYYYLLISSLCVSLSLSLDWLMIFRALYSYIYIYKSCYWFALD